MKKTVKINEQDIRNMVSEILSEALKPIGSLKGMVGYKCLDNRMLSSVLQNGYAFPRNQDSRNLIAGSGAYFWLEEPTEDMKSIYGKNILKVQILGEHPVYDNGGTKFTVVNNASDIIPLAINGEDILKYNKKQNQPYGSQWVSTSTINEEKIRKVVRKILKEWADDDNYYGGGLPDSQFKEEPPQNYGISAQQIQQLKSMVDTLYDIANYTDGDTQQLFSAAEAIEGYLSANS